MAKFTLHRTNRTKKDGTPKAGVRFEYQIIDENGALVAKRVTNHDGFIVAYGNGRGWSYGSSARSMRNKPTHIAHLVQA